MYSIKNFAFYFSKVHVNRFQFYVFIGLVSNFNLIIRHYEPMSRHYIRQYKCIYSLSLSLRRGGKYWRIKLDYLIIYANFLVKKLNWLLPKLVSKVNLLRRLFHRKWKSILLQVLKRTKTKLGTLYKNKILYLLNS